MLLHQFLVQQPKEERLTVLPRRIPRQERVLSQLWLAVGGAGMGSLPLLA